MVQILWNSQFFKTNKQTKTNHQHIVHTRCYDSIPRYAQEKRRRVHTKTCTQMSIATLSVSAFKWKPKVHQLVNG